MNDEILIFILVRGFLLVGGMRVLFGKLLMFQAMGFVCAMLVLVKSGKLTLHGDACIADYPNTMLFFLSVKSLY
jgi:hypothetical protein